VQPASDRSQQNPEEFGEQETHQSCKISLGMYMHSVYTQCTYAIVILSYIWFVTLIIFECKYLFDETAVEKMEEEMFFYW